MMDIKVAKLDLQRVMKTAGKVVDRTSKTPMASSVLLRSDGSVVTVNAVGLDVAYSATLNAKVTGRGDIALNAAELQRLSGDAPGEEIAMKVDDTGWLEAKAGKARYKIGYIAGREYPSVPKPATAIWWPTAGAPLLDAFRRGGFAHATEGDRGALMGVLIESPVKGGTIIASGDGPRFARQRLAMEMPKPVCSSFPARWFELAPIVGAGIELVELCVDSGRIYIRANGATLSSSSLLGEFPSRESLEPVFGRECNVRVSVDRERFADAAKRVAPLTTELSGLVLDVVAGSMTVSSRDSTGREISDEIDCETTGKIKISMVAKYVTDALATMSGERVELKMSGPLDPILLSDSADPNFDGIVMPMRLP